MNKLPKKFPEYSIMYKTILKQIDILKNKEVDTQKEKEEIKLKIDSYQKELNKIKEKFPENFFDEAN